MSDRKAHPRPEADPDRNPYPLMLLDYTKLPIESLVFDNVLVRMIEPYAVCVTFFAQGHYLHPGRQDHGDSLTGRHIAPYDLLIFDADRTAPVDGAIQLVKDGERRLPRVCRVLGDGRVEFHAAAEGYPVLSGEREIVGTLAAVIRATDGRPEGGG